MSRSDVIFVFIRDLNVFGLLTHPGGNGLTQVKNNFPKHLVFFNYEKLEMDSSGLGRNPRETFRLPLVKVFVMLFYAM